MSSASKKFYFLPIFLSILFLLVGYHFRQKIVLFAESTLNLVQPCTVPIKYSIGDFDSKFGWSKEQFLDIANKAAVAWETPINRDLFEYDPEGSLKLNLIYDYRQEATKSLSKLGIEISNDRATYDKVKVKYQSLLSTYKASKRELESMITSFDDDKKGYESEVKYWNERGGASNEIYTQLENRREDLNDQIQEINIQEKKVNSLVNNINATVIVLNQLAKELNIDVSKYNSVGSSVGEEFNEGEYVEDGDGKRINIYQFDTNEKLLRLMEHELGHAIGLPHIDNPKAIMYRLNQAANEKLTADDITALKNACGIRDMVPEIESSN